MPETVRFTATGIIRRIDDLGRIIIPKEIRSRLNIEEGAPLELSIYDGGVYLRVYDPNRVDQDFAEETTLT